MYIQVKLSREEMKAVRNLVRSVAQINGTNVTFRDCFKVNKLGYTMSAISGTCTIKIDPDAFIEYVELINDLAEDALPVVKSMYSLAQTLVRMLERYEKRYDNFMKRFDQDIPAEFNTQSVNESCEVDENLFKRYRTKDVSPVVERSGKGSWI